MSVVQFQHRHAGHCESGVTASLLTHYGLPLSEPMALGLSSSLTFVHLPWIKIGGFPLTAYRMLPGSVYGGLRGALKLKMCRRRYRSPELAMQDLDRELAAGRIVGLQTSVYWLPYFPPEMRFHFNAHNLIVFGKEGDDYLISDPVFDRPQRCAAADLQRARFAKGAFAPKGLMYYPLSYDPHFDLAGATRRAIRWTVRMMLFTPLPCVGIWAVRRLADRIERLPQSRLGARYARLFIGNIVRMQEEIGTGGGGFRFMYAAFLQEAGHKLGMPVLLEAASRMTASGDSWRQFALLGARFGRERDDVDCSALAAQLRLCADSEAAVYQLLRAI
jgi:hypothetical protein